MQKHYFSFGKQNYLMIIAGVVLVAIGFLLMTGGGSEDPNVFNEQELFSAQRITMAPALVIAGYIVVIFGIMRKSEVAQSVSSSKASPKSKDNTQVIDK
jgi:hypothetical protein